MIPLVPAIIPKSQTELIDTLAKLDFSTEVQIDVVDGSFVPFTSWPYEPKGDPKAIYEVADRFTLEVDLMVKDQLAAADSWLEAGADMLVFHLEGISLAKLKDFISFAPATVGIAALNDTSFAELVPYLEIVDFVQVMGIANIGTQGQVFDRRALDRIRQIKEQFPQLLISVDGSVNENTIEELYLAGVGRLVVGSAIIKAENPAQAFWQLHKKINPL